MPREFLSPDEIRDLLTEGRFDDLIGKLENEFFDAKAEPWDLDTESGKLDLAKDISSLANWRGGVIVVGATSREAPPFQRNEVRDVRGLPRRLAPTDRYSHLIREWIYPVPEGVAFRWHPNPRDTDRGVIGVDVPDQREELKPFLVAHYLSESGKKIDAIFGMVQRLGATTKTETVAEIHTLLREGRRLDAIHQKLDTIIARTEAPVPDRQPWILRILRAASRKD